MGKTNLNRQRMRDSFLSASGSMRPTSFEIKGNKTIGHLKVNNENKIRKHCHIIDCDTLTKLREIVQELLLKVFGSTTREMKDRPYSSKFESMYQESHQSNFLWKWHFVYNVGLRIRLNFRMILVVVFLDIAHLGTNAIVATTVVCKIH